MHSNISASTKKSHEGQPLHRNEGIFQARAAPRGGPEKSLFRRHGTGPGTALPGGVGGPPPLELSTEPPTAGGVGFAGRLEDCQRANLHLRTASRILLRIGSFRAANFGVFEKRAAEVAWELFLPPGAPLSVRTAVRRCRLIHGGAIGERTLAAIGRRIGAISDSGKGSRPATPTDQTIYVRGYRDRFAFSVDSSGDPLYIRGLKPHAGAAPIRETIAAGVLQQIGYTGDRPLVDPMCGAGTFSLEAAMTARCIPAGWYRDFAFRHWPSFSKKRWQHLRSAAERRIRNTAPRQILASDIDPDACRRLQETVSRFGWNDTITVRKADFFSLAPSALADLPGWVVLNPPYGKRIHAGQKTSELFRSVVERLQTAWTGWRAALLVPAAIWKAFAIPGFRILRTVHGGIPLVVQYGRLG